MQTYRVVPQTKRGNYFLSIIGKASLMVKWSLKCFESISLRKKRDEESYHFSTCLLILDHAGQLKHRSLKKHLS